MLIAPFLQKLKNMIKDLAYAGVPCGLQLHPEKTKVLTNVKWRRGEQKQEHVWVGHMKVQLL